MLGTQYSPLDLQYGSADGGGHGTIGPAGAYGAFRSVSVPVVVPPS
jgi:hypothetical protein